MSSPHPSAGFIRMRSHREGRQSPCPGKVAKRRYEGVGSPRGGDVTLFVDGEKVGQGRVDATQPLVFSASETADVGSDTATLSAMTRG
jgi:hypothetical protein